MKNYFKHKMRGKSPIMIVGTVIFGAIVIGGLAVLFGFVIMSLWNWLMPELFGLPILSYWQAVGLFILTKILFGFGSGSGGHKKHHDSSGSCRKNSHGPKSFSKWEHYGKFWEEKGQQAYSDYMQELTIQKSGDNIEPASK